MLEILTGQFFWGIVVGLILSFVGGYILADFTVRKNRENQKAMFVRLCRDAVKNIKSIIEQIGEGRRATGKIQDDYLTLIDVEIQVFGRNRELLVLLPENESEAIRKFMNQVAIHKADTFNQLQEFYRLRSLADQMSAEGNGPQSGRTNDASLVPLSAAQRAADQLSQQSSTAENLLIRLDQIK